MKQQNLKDKIIEISREVFAHYGYQKTSVEQIAAIMHKSKTSIYYHFKSKEAIFEAVLDYEADILRKLLMEKMMICKTASEKLKTYILIRMQYLNKLINFYEALKNDYLSHMPFIEKTRKKFDNEEINIIKNILTEGVVSKEFKIKNIEITSLAIFTAMKGLEIPLIVNDYEINLENRLNYLLDILFYGIKK